MKFIDKKHMFGDTLKVLPSDKSQNICKFKLFKFILLHFEKIFIEKKKSKNIANIRPGRRSS